MWLRRVLYRNMINLFWPITARTFLWTFFKGVINDSQSGSQAAQASAMRWSPCVIRVMGKVWELVWEYLRPLLGIKLENTVKFSMKIPRLAFTMHFLLSDHLLRRNEAILGTYPFLGLLLPREGQGCTLHFQTMVLKQFIDAKWRCGPRWGTVYYGGRVTKLVFNGRVSWLMCTWVVKRLTGNFGSKLRFSVGLASVKRRFSVNIPIQTLIFSP